jgi:hypothetical protein
LDRAHQSLVQPVDDLVLVGIDTAHVDALEPGADTERLGLVRVVGDLRRMQQGLGGDAAAVQAGATDLAPLDERHSHSELGRSERASIAAAAAAENDDVVPAAAVRH